MNKKEANEKMKISRAKIKTLKATRMEISEFIQEEENKIRKIKGAIFRGEIQ